MGVVVLTLWGWWELQFWPRGPQLSDLGSEEIPPAPQSQKPSPVVLLGPILASASFPDGCVCIFFSFFAFFFFPLFYYCFNNNKRARGSQALARSWRPMGVLGRGRVEVSGGQRWRVKKEEVGDLGLAQESSVLAPSLTHPLPLPTSLPPHGFSPPLSKSCGRQDPPPVCPCLPADSSSWTSHLPPSISPLPHGQPAISLQNSKPRPVTIPSQVLSPSSSSRTAACPVLLPKPSFPLLAPCPTR